jgi:MFS family permease
MLKQAFKRPSVGVAGAFLLGGSLVWYLYAVSFLTNALYAALSLTRYNEVLPIVLGLNILALAVCTFLGVFVFRHVGRRVVFLRYWLLAGVALSFGLFAASFAELIGLCVLSVLVGAYFGFGMPVSLAYFATSTEIENRARLGGGTFGAVFVLVIVFGALGGLGVVVGVLLLAATKVSGLALLKTWKLDKLEHTAVTSVTYGSVLRNRSFQLYFVPWIMFSVVNNLARPLTESLFFGYKIGDVSFLDYSTLIANVIAGVFAIVSGFFGDYMGRKRLVIAGFTLMGVGYAFLGLFSQNVFGWWFYTIADGIAWGAFYTIFVMTIWGDLAQGRGVEKFYALGSLPFLFALYIQFSIATNIHGGLGTNSIFSVASIFLFLAVLPLAYAPETLDKCLKRRELEDYVKQAQSAKVKVDST